MFEKMDWEKFQKSPFVPGFMQRDELWEFFKIGKAQIEEIEEIARQLSDQFSEMLAVENTAIIDRNGAFLGLERQGKSNTDYLKEQNLRKMLNVNASTINDIIKILKYYYNNEQIHIADDFPAGIQIIHYGQSKEKVDFNRFIAEVVGAGISYATKEYFAYEEGMTVQDSKMGLNFHILDAVLYNDKYDYSGFVQYGAMEETREESLSAEETLEYEVIGG